MFHIFSERLWSASCIRREYFESPKNASIAYDNMMQAKQSADTLNKDAVFAEKTLSAIKQKLATAEREAEISRKKSEQARISMEQAINQWRQASDALANEWGKTDRK